MIEYYDHALFSIFLPILAPVFFPGKDAYSALAHSYWFMFVVMVLRPFGGFFFGTIGDRFGRRHALIYSMAGIAVLSAVIGLLPTYGQIGIAATILVAVIKALQTMCFGGEFNGAGIFVVEHAGEQYAGRASSLLYCFTTMGAVLASAIGVLLTLDFMPSWSWRVAFLVGGLFGLFATYARKHMLESPKFKVDARDDSRVRDLFIHFPEAMVAGFFIGGAAAIPYSTVLLIINPILTATHFFTTHQFMLLQTGINIFAIIMFALSGLLADRYGIAKLMIIVGVLLTLFAYPLLCLVDSRDIYLILIAEFSIIALAEMFLGPSHAFLKQRFPMHLRYRGSSISFCLGMSVLGGLTPVIENYLYSLRSQFSMISLWLVLISVLTVLSIKVASKVISGKKGGAPVR